MQALHALAAHGDAAVGDEAHVALLLDDRLLLRAWQTDASQPPRSRDPPRRGGGGRSPQRRQSGVHLGDRRADVGVRLEDRREQLGLQAPRQLEPLDAAEDPVDRGDLLERLGVEDHQLLLDSERERRRLAEPCCGINAS